MKKKYWLIGLTALGMLLGSCSDDDVTNNNNGNGDNPGGTDPNEEVFDGVSLNVPDGGFRTERCRVLAIAPEVHDGKEYLFSWTMGDSELGKDRVLDFIALEPKDYQVMLRVMPADGKEVVLEQAVNITVTKEKKEYSPYVTSVPDYRPAPGQFVNELPLYEEGDSQEKMNEKVLASIGNNARSLVSLGGYGGYVVCGFDHTIVNVPGEYDFLVLGNAFWANANPNPDASREGGSCEPGVVMVAYDRNRNGKADADEWYELAGSEFNNEKTVKNYRITYNRPDPSLEPDEVPEGERSWNVFPNYIAWEDNSGKTGFIPKNIYHKQNYYPNWIEEDQLVFEGTCLPNNAVDESGTGSYWVLYAYPWGYADNMPNNDERAGFKIEWAVDSKGEKVHLPGVDFVKIYTGVNQCAGWLGETSTEVMGVNDLHLLKK